MSIWLSETDLRELLPLPDLLKAMESALIAFSTGRVCQPVRIAIEQPNAPVFWTMPAFLGAVMGAKLVTARDPEIEPHLPAIHATIVLLDGTMGTLLACMDGRYITEARTAAVSALAMRALAGTHGSTLAIIGSGVQARSHLAALTPVRPFKQVRCWSPTRGHMRNFVERHPNVEPAETAEVAVKGADVIALVTSSRDPVIRDEWIEPGACIVSVGACMPDQREMDPALVTRARLIVDSREAALKESGDVAMGIADGLFSANHIAAELGEVLAGAARGRTSAEQVTIFKSLGMAVEDIAAAQLAYTRALETGRGLQLG